MSPHVLSSTRRRLLSTSSAEGNREPHHTHNHDHEHAQHNQQRYRQGGELPGYSREEEHSPLVESLTNSPQNCELLKLLLKNKVGLNLLNERAIYNLYNLPLFTDNQQTEKTVTTNGQTISYATRTTSNQTTDEDRWHRPGKDQDKLSSKISNLVLSKISSSYSDKPSLLAQHDTLRKTKSNQADYYPEEAVTPSRLSHRYNPLNLLRIKSRTEEKSDSSLPTPRPLSANSPSITDDSKFEVQTHTPHNASQLTYERNHQDLRNSLYHPTISDSNLISELPTGNIKISVINSSDKVFLPTCYNTSRGNSRPSRVNRNLNSNINGIGNALDEDLQRYESRSRRIANSHQISSRGGEGTNNDVSENENEENDSSNPVLHTFAIVVSVPKEINDLEYETANSPSARISNSINSSLASHKNSLSAVGTNSVLNVAPEDSGLRPISSLSSASLLSSDVENYTKETAVSQLNTRSSPPSINKESVSFTKTNIDLSKMLVFLSLISKIFWKELSIEYTTVGPQLDSKEEFLVGNSVCGLNLIKDFNYFIPADDEIDLESLNKSFSQLSRQTSISLSENSLDLVNSVSKLPSEGYKNGLKVIVGQKDTQPLQTIKLKSIEQVKEDPYYHKNSVLKEYMKNTGKEFNERHNTSFQKHKRSDFQHLANNRDVIFDKSKKRLSVPVDLDNSQFSFQEDFRADNSKSNISYKYPAGDYIFVIPVVFDASLPETIRAPHASLNYKFNLCLKRDVLGDAENLQRTGSQRRYSISRSLKKMTKALPRNDEKIDDDSDLFSADDDNLADFDRRLIKTSRMNQEFAIDDEDEDESEENNNNNNNNETVENNNSTIKIAQNTSQSLTMDAGPLEAYASKKTSASNNNSGYFLADSASSKTVSTSSFKNPGKHNIKETLISKSFRLPVVRTPPDTASSMNKAIYVNRIWNNSLQYELSFPSKFVRLNSEIPFSIKLIPLCKDIFMKKVKINVLERVSYVSKTLEVEFDEGKKNAKDHNIKERVIPLAELRTKPEGGYAVREDFLNLPTDLDKNHNGETTGKGYLNSHHEHENSKNSRIYSKIKSSVMKDDISQNRASSMLAYCFNNNDDNKYAHLPYSPDPRQGNAKKTLEGKEKGKDIIIDRSLLIKMPLFFKGIKSHNHSYHSNNHITSKKNGHGDNDSNNDLLHSRETNTKIKKLLSKTPLRSKTVIGSTNKQLPDDYLYMNKTEKDLWDEIKSSKAKVKYGDCFLDVSRYVPRLVNESTFDFRSRQKLIPDLYPDSNYFNYVSVSHRIQICFRISKVETDYDDNVENSTGTRNLHHYEVIIDAPIVLMSDLCKDENVILPPYLETPADQDLTITNAEIDREIAMSLNRELDTDRLPTFEEAMSQVNSPILGLVPEHPNEHGGNTIDEIAEFPLDSQRDASPIPIPKSDRNADNHGLPESGVDDNEMNSMVLLSPTSTIYSNDWTSRPGSPLLSTSPLSRFNSANTHNYASTTNIDEALSDSCQNQNHNESYDKDDKYDYSSFSINDTSDNTKRSRRGSIVEKLDFDQMPLPSYDEIVGSKKESKSTKEVKT